jgi:CBS domain containing-hemolysin-like protein
MSTAFTSVNRLKVELKKKQGKQSGILLSGFFDHPGQFIGMALVGFNVFLVFYGLLIGEMLEPLWNYLINRLAYQPDYVNVIRLLFETLLSTFIVLLLGVFLPIAFWRSKNEWILSRPFSYLLGFFKNLFSGVADFFVYLAEWILKYLFNIRVDEHKEPFRRADLDYFFQHNRDQDTDGQDMNAELIENALTLPTVKVRQCLIPRKEIVGVEINTSIEKVHEKFMDTKLSKLVVFEKNIDQIVGYVHQLDLFKKPAQIQDILLPIPPVPESMSAFDLIGKFSKDRKSIAWVIDEFGGTSGIVTMEDLLEEIFGEIQDEYDTEDFEEKQVSEKEYLFSGRLELDYLREKYGFEFPENDSETLSGYIIHEHETIPKVKERIIIGDLEFDIITVSDTRIEMVRLKQL